MEIGFCNQFKTIPNNEFQWNFYNNEKCKYFGLVIRNDLLKDKYKTSYFECFEINNKKSKHLTKNIEHNNKEINEKVSFINSLELDIEKAILSNKDVSLKQALKDLKELVRYSDPMSNENAKQEEAILKDLTSQIAEKCEANEEGVLSLVEKAKMHLKIRNEICLKSK